MFIALNSQRPFNLLANEEPSRLRSGRMPALSGMSWRNNKIFRIAWIAAAQSVNKELCETANTKNACFSTTAMNDCARLGTESLTWPLISTPPTLEHSATTFSNRESTRHTGESILDRILHDHQPQKQFKFGCLDRAVTSQNLALGWMTQARHFWCLRPFFPDLAECYRGTE